MTCPHCGAAVSANVGVCPTCRGRLGSASAMTGMVTGFGAVMPHPSSTDATVFGSPSDAAETIVGSHPPPELRRVVSDGPQGPLGPGEAFGSRYHIIRLLGIGGMGAVYQAFDAELGMAVALKVIRPEASADPEAAREMQQRFKQELVLARKVTHKNVVRIHDLGEIDGIKYITMPYLEGADLASLLQRSGKLSVPAALKIVRDVAAGLVAAHEAGIVHRDLKPANIMVAEDRAIIMDFGIARLSAGLTAGQLAEATSPETVARANAAVTSVGAIVGTLDYMAPEQARGEGVDQRADIYALGYMFSDMLIGRPAPPDGVVDPLAALKRRMEKAPASVRTVDATIPEPIDRLIARCLEPDPAARFQTSAALVAELDRLDENGRPLPIRRVVGMKILAAVVAVALALLGGSWWYARTLIPATQHDPVSVVIADLQNNTSDSAFDRTLEPTLRRALEDATFVSAYDRSRIRSTLLVQPPDRLDEEAARAIAVKQGLGVVISGAIDRRGNGYELSMRAVQSVTGDVVATVRDRASNKEQVLEVVTRLVSDIRTALGDETSESDQLFAMRSVSTASLEVVGHYAAAMQSQSRGSFEEARQSLLKATEVDPKFGLGYQGLAVLARNSGRLQESDKYIKEALSYLEGMTERERFATRGFYVSLTGDYQQCVKEYGEMTARFSGDAIAYNQVAGCWSKLRNLRQAVDNNRQALRILPNHPVFRSNLAINAAYASDFETAEQEAKTVQPPSDLATLVIAFAQLGRGRLQEATETYQKLATISTRGKSWAASGLADVALHEARFTEAARLLQQGAAAEIEAKNPDKAARKLTSLAYAHLSAGRTAPAVAAAEKALQHSKVSDVRLLAGRIFAEAGELPRARELAASFASELAAEPQAYGKIIEGVIALKEGDPRLAVKTLLEANGVLDTWLGHFDLGRAYLQAGAFVQADSEFDSCLKRRGEALALLIDQEPTYGYLPTVYYYQGLVREQLKNAGFADSYRAYLNIRGKSTEDPLLPEIRKRAG